MSRSQRACMSFAFCLATALLLAGCGGGGGTTPAVPGGGGAGGGGAGGAMMTAAELQMGMDALAAMNAHRATKALPALTWYQPGAQIGYEHCVAMETGNFFAHTNPMTNSTPGTRAQAAGIMHDPMGFTEVGSNIPFVGENLAGANGNPTVTFTGQQAVDGWVNSPGHHTQIDAPNAVPTAQQMPPWTHCGVGVRVTQTQIWYTATFFRNPMP